MLAARAPPEGLECVLCIYSIVNASEHMEKSTVKAEMIFK